VNVGELVRVHWGNCDWSGEQGVSWGYSPGLIVGEIRWWKNAKRRVSPCGDVNILFRGEIVSFNIGRLQPMSEVNDESR